MTISDIQGRSKQFLGRIPASAVYAAILILSSAASFGLGIVAAREMDLTGAKDTGFWIEDVSATSSLPAAAGNVLAPAEKEVQAPVIPVGGQYVASKSGTRYYLPTCGSAKTIKEENRIWFATKQEAEAAGYTPAKNCKGI